ncbi:MAG: hypothetical protein HY791_34645 [Deltaproteobacteria bacterium]|nr:hypothetical protein [Deltaproteobacteria bacterium]
MTNRYDNAELGFSITKPEDWAFLPTRWALSLRKRSDPDNDELQRILELASVPFVYFHFDHGDTRYAIPTVQAACRGLISPELLDRSAILGASTSQLARLFKEFEVLEATTDVIVSGFHANRIVSEFRLPRKGGPDLYCRSTSYAIFVRRLGFTVGISGPAEGPYQEVETLRGVERSIVVT